eukprot:854538-Pleurochrysis_carterae.AAC.3
MKNLDGTRTRKFGSSRAWLAIGRLIGSCRQFALKVALELAQGLIEASAAREFECRARAELVHSNQARTELFIRFPS